MLYPSIFYKLMLLPINFVILYIFFLLINLRIIDFNVLFNLDLFLMIHDTISLPNDKIHV